jgi:hypothetical protein
VGLPLREAGGRRRAPARGGRGPALRPEDEFREAARVPAEAVGFEAPAGVLAHAVVFSGGSLSPPGLPEVPPKPTLTPQCVAAAIKLAAATVPPEQAEQIFQRFLAIGIGIAGGRYTEKLMSED